MSDADYKRLAKQSAFMALSVPGMTDSDLLHEALVRLLAGRRQWRRGVDAGKTLYMIMLSIARDTRDRAKEAPIDHFAVVSEDGIDNEGETPQEMAVSVAVGTPERIAGYREMFSMLEELVADDEDEQSVLLSWAVGISATEAASQAGMNMKDYDAARKRLDRKISAVKKQMGQ
jgi:DNA-directed RNA polymerase specialized sigma24 family protein